MNLDYYCFLTVTHFCFSFLHWLVLSLAINLDSLFLKAFVYTSLPTDREDQKIQKTHRRMKQRDTYTNQGRVKRGNKIIKRKVRNDVTTEIE